MFSKKINYILSNIYFVLFFNFFLLSYISTRIPSTPSSSSCSFTSSYSLLTPSVHCTGSISSVSNCSIQCCRKKQICFLVYSIPSECRAEVDRGRGPRRWQTDERKQRKSKTLDEIDRLPGIEYSPTIWMSVFPSSWFAIIREMVVISNWMPGQTNWAVAL